MDLDVEWSTPSFRITPGRDPLGLQTITTDRIMPELTPGILALSQRAAYFGFHLFLLDEYERQRLPASRAQMSDFFRSREYELALATSLCERGCGSEAGIGVVGRLAIANPRRGGDGFARGFSVDSSLGAYGLYYRSPLVTLGLVIPAGSTLGDESTPIDLVDRALAREIASAFRTRIEGTEYFRTFMRSTRPVPEEVLAEYAQHACLCRVRDATTEQTLLRQALFGDREGIPPRETLQRRRAFALFLLLLDRDASVVGDSSSSPFRAAIWDSFVERVPADAGSPLSDALGEWAALVAREALQEALSSIWTDFCRLGLERQGIYGMSSRDVGDLIDSAISAAQLTFPDGSTFDPDPAEPLASLVAAAAVGLRDLPLEEIRTWIARYDSVPAGLSALAAIPRLLPEVTAAPRGWRYIGARDGANQPGLLSLSRLLGSLEDERPSLGQFARRVVRTLILSPHERIASSKLPEFTFRFRLADGRLRFYGETMRGHFGPSDIRHVSLKWLSQDLGLWSWVGDSPRISTVGQELMREVFG